jgi:hypothetical protein
MLKSLEKYESIDYTVNKVYKPLNGCQWTQDMNVPDVFNVSNWIGIVGESEMESTLKKLKSSKTKYVILQLLRRCATKQTLFCSIIHIIHMCWVNERTIHLDTSFDQSSNTVTHFLIPNKVVRNRITFFII